MCKTISILGQNYTVEYKTSAEDDCLLECDGYCDKTSKRIVVVEKEKIAI